MYDNLNAPHCTCHYQYAWHYEGPKRAMETWDSVLSEYAADCTIGQHAALAALLAPKQAIEHLNHLMSPEPWKTYADTCEDCANLHSLGEPL